MNYRPTHFILQEFVSKDIFDRLGERAWVMMDERILRHADDCRTAFGVLTINNWHSGGNRTESGLRVPGMVNYKETSQHSYGRATDMISPTLSGEDMRKFILAHPEKFPHVTRMEAGTSWLHSDTGNAPRITLVNP